MSKNILRACTLRLGLIAVIAACPFPAFATDIARLSADAAAGDAQAQFEIGNAYMKGDGVPVDMARGVKWCTLAAEQGLPAAQMQLGLKYLNGEGVSLDRPQGEMWIVLAKDGDPHYDSVLHMVQSHMTPAELLDSRAAAERWKAQHTVAPVMGLAATR